jgi:hypothetical protein
VADDSIILKEIIWACPSGSGYPLQVLALPSSGCGLSVSIPHANRAKRKIIFKSILKMIKKICLERQRTGEANLLNLREKKIYCQNLVSVKILFTVF